MSGRLEIMGVHHIVANEPCYLIEIALHDMPESFDFGSITQEYPGQPESNWQVPYDEQQINRENPCRWAFFFHYLAFDRPLLSPFGVLSLPEPTPMPEHLKHIEYSEP